MDIHEGGHTLRSTTPKPTGGSKKPQLDPKSREKSIPRPIRGFLSLRLLRNQLRRRDFSPPTSFTAT